MDKTEILLKTIKSIPYCKVIVELGSQFFDITDERGYTWGCSTYHLAKYATENDILFITIDIDPTHTDFSIKMLQENKFSGMAINRDGCEALRELKIFVDFLYLDTADDPEVSFEQFKVIEPYLTKNSKVAIDDIVNYSTPEYIRMEGKGSILLPYCRSKGYKVEKIPAYYKEHYLCDVGIINK